MIFILLTRPNKPFDTYDQFDLLRIYARVQNFTDAAKLVNVSRQTWCQKWYESGLPSPKVIRVKTSDLDLPYFEVGIVSDLHWGSIYQQKTIFDSFIRDCKERGIATLVNLGDSIDGLMSRPNHEQSRFLHSISDYEEYFLENYPVFEKSYIICLSSDSQVYTDESGWVNYDKLSIGNTIWSWINGKIIKGTITNVIINNYIGDMINVKCAGGQDQLITPDHAFLYTPHTNKLVATYKLASSIPNNTSSTIIPLAGVLDRNDFDISDAIISLIGIVVTEGTIMKASTPNGRNAIQIYQNEPNASMIRFLLEMSEIKYSEYKGSSDIARVFYLGVDEAQKIFKYLPTKNDIGLLLNILSSRQLTILYNWMMFGDGSMYETGAGVFYTSYENLANQFNLLTLLIGYRSWIRKVIRNITIKKNNKEYHYNNYVQYEVCVSSFPNLVLSHSSVKRVPYNGIVFDISTTTGNFLARRNNKPFFTGNCGNHETSLQKHQYGYDFVKEMASKRSDLTYLKQGSVIEGPGNVKFCLHHGGGSCESYDQSRNKRMKNRTLQLMSEGSCADVYLLGHCHKISVLPSYMNSTIIGTGCFCAPDIVTVKKFGRVDVAGLILGYQINELGQPVNLKFDWRFAKEYGGLVENDY